MEGQHINSELLTEVPEAYLHQLTKGVKTLYKTGKLTYFKLSETQYSITIQDFVYKFNTETGLFFKVTIGSHSSYFFTPDTENLYSITIDRYQGSAEFEAQINKLTEIYSYQKAKNYHLFQKLVEENYPNPDVPIMENSRVNRVIEQVGNVVGEGFKIMGGWSASAVNYVGEFIESKVSPGELSENNKQRVEAVSQKTKAATDTVVGVTATISKPIIETTTQLGNNASSSFQSSKYALVRKFNDVAITSLKSGGTAAKGFWSGLCAFGNAVKTQSTNIWNKKFNTPQNEQSQQPLVEEPTIIKTQERVVNSSTTQNPVN